MQLSEKRRFLEQPASYPRPTRAVETRETHTALVFLTDDRAYKMKKPVRFDFLDFRDIAARAHFCSEEVRLNRVLAGDVYVGTVPLVVRDDGSPALGGKGEIVDWLVEMVRLPEDEMLEARIAAGTATPEQIRVLAGRLSRFYAERMSRTVDGAPYLGHLVRESAINSAHLQAMRDRLDGASCRDVVDAAAGMLDRSLPEIGARVAAGLIVEGHGDLRPEHVCLLDPPIVFDCLEFNPSMRLIDPYDEVNYLGLECEFLGAPWVKPILLEVLERAVGHRPSDGVLRTYGMFRALLRARLSIDHLLDERPRTPEKWPRQARAYLEAARRLAW